MVYGKKSEQIRPVAPQVAQKRNKEENKTNNNAMEKKKLRSKNVEYFFSEVGVEW